MLFNAVNSDVEVKNFDLTLRNFATSYQPKDNVETTLKCLLGHFSEYFPKFLVQ